MWKIMTCVTIWTFMTSHFIALHSVWHRLSWTCSHGSMRKTLFPSFVGKPVLFFWTCHSLSQHRDVQGIDSILSSFHPCCFGYDQEQSYRTEFAKINTYCLFHKNCLKAPCLPCINLNVLKSISLLELLLFQIFLKSFTVLMFSSQGYVLDENLWFSL